MKKVAFIHPDLGIGGAEQLVINLALALKEKKVDATIFTPHHDKNHCFKETIDGNLKVKVVGSFFPNQIFGKAVTLCAIIRMLIATLYILIFERQYEIFIVDQVSICLPFIWLFRKKSMFYCHFPDKLLCVNRKSIIKKIYRFFLDIIEEICMFPANKIFVNSEFTKQIYNENFKLLHKYKKQPETLYPSIDFDKFESYDEKKHKIELDSKINKPFFFSLNRYEKKKNIGLAIQAFSKMECKDQSQLIIAGGYESRVKENVENKTELENLVKQLGLNQNQVIFQTNITNEQRLYYLQKSIAVLYTPSNEHFGIVPVEAMYNQTPVIALNNGGPKESIKSEVTGYLVEESYNQEIQWAAKMDELFKNQQKRNEMGKQGRQRVIKLFSFQTFAEQLYQSYLNLISKKQKQK